MSPGTVKYFIDKINEDILLIDEDFKKAFRLRKVTKKIQLYSNIYKKSSQLYNITIDFELMLRCIENVQSDALESLIEYQNLLLNFKNTSMEIIKDLELLS